jgi:hypothetical protein
MVLEYGLLPSFVLLPFNRLGPFCLSKNDRKKDTKKPNSLGWVLFLIVSSRCGHPALKQRILWDRGFITVQCIS